MNFRLTLKKRLPTVLVTLGSLMIANVAWPIISHHLFVSPRLQKSDLKSPISLEQTVFYSHPNDQATTQPTISQAQALQDVSTDYTKASNWFPSAKFNSSTSSKITHYTISIPKLNLEEAVVTIGGEDLAESLIQYPGTANPGQLGAPVVFGHSVLRSFYNPNKQNPNRYISVFSTIMTLDSGDEIFIDFDGIQYRYAVREKFEVKPDDVFILRQRYDSRNLKLVTCVPEGTYLRRGIIEAQIIDTPINSVRTL